MTMIFYSICYVQICYILLTNNGLLKYYISNVLLMFLLTSESVFALTLWNVD